MAQKISGKAGWFDNASSANDPTAVGDSNGDSLTNILFQNDVPIGAGIGAAKSEAPAAGDGVTAAAPTLATADGSAAGSSIDGTSDAGAPPIGSGTTAAPSSVVQPLQLGTSADTGVQNTSSVLGSEKADAGTSVASLSTGTSATSSDAVAAPDATTADKSGPATVAPVSAGLHINLIADANNVNAPAGWAAAVQTAASIIEQNFSDPVTINLRYGYASFSNVVDPSLIGSGGAYANTDAGTTGNYSTTTGWLLGDRTTADDFLAYTDLPNSSASFPGGANNFYVPNAELRALGQLGNNATIDGSAAFGTAISNSDIVEVALHELTHAMGRITLHYTPSNLPVMADWYRYDAAGHFQWTEGNSSASPSYFSIDAGATRIADFGETSDYSDWLNSGVQNANDPFNEFYTPGVTLHSLTTQDLRELDVLGFNRVDDYVQNVTTTASVATTGVGSTGSIETGGDHDWFRVTLTGGVKYRFDEHGAPSSQGTLTDPLLALWNSAGTTQLASNDDVNGAADRESEFFFTPASSGTYWVDAAAFSTLTGTYTVHVAPDDFAAGVWTTGAVSVGGAATGSIEVSGDHDWRSVSLTAGTSYRFDEHGTHSGQGTLTDTVLALWNSTGTTQLAFNDDINGAANRESQFFYTPATTGTYYVDAAAFSSLTGTYTVHAAVTPAARDFNFDGHSDLLWQNTSGQGYIWETSGTTVIGSGDLGNPGASWHEIGTGDFNADGKADILWQNDSGQGYIYLMNGTSVIGSGDLGNPGPSWHEIGTGDFNGDGKSDILWQNDSGQGYIWEMNGTTVIGSGDLGNPGPSWHEIGTGDFNADGKSDILWQNDSGEAYIWEMNGTSVIGGGSLGNPGASWHAIRSGDFNGDGLSDILWQNISGEAAIWEMNGTSIIGAASLGNPGASWHALGTGDYNGDGKSDILWQNTSGEVVVWEMNGTSVSGSGSLGNPGASWHVLG